jgi:hypothetical protein
MFEIEGFFLRNFDVSPKHDFLPSLSLILFRQNLFSVATFIGLVPC